MNFCFAFLFVGCYNEIKAINKNHILSSYLRIERIKRNLYSLYSFISNLKLIHIMKL